ncbi:MAG: FAD-dependent oxidoreductase [Firmicutes bacterium]|nr:FAD-dependent oxidoreductase [Bacillota bacterium]
MKLFEPCKIGNLTLKNRIVLAPMGTTTDQSFAFNQKDVDYYEERAKGGTGLVLTGAVVCSEEFEPAPCQLLNSIKHAYWLHEIAEHVHIHGAKFGIQLSPGIGRMNWIDPFTPPYSASPCPNYYNPELICRELPTEGVKRLVKAMGYSAKLAKDAGVDIIEVHAYGGYLIDQFTSAKWNHRSDEYGGSFENRQRFLFEIIDEIRKTCGKDYPIAVKMTLDSVDDEERPIEEGLAIAKRLAEIPVDLIHFGRGAYSCRWRMVSSVYQPPGFDLEAAKIIREVTGNVPIMAHGKLNHVPTAKQAIEEGIVDFIAIGHGMIADPHWANKVRKGMEEEIIPCIGCGGCHANSMKGWARPCAVNPTSMHEKEYVLTPMKENKKVLVIGGGPGGLKAAASAAQRGMDVTLWEKNAYLGGALAAAGQMRFKKDVKSQLEYLIRQVNKYNVKVELNKEANLEMVKSFNPDFVVVASGANPIRIPIPGHDQDHVYTAVPALMNQDVVGENVVIIGGGEVGCEMGCEFAAQGKKVTIVEIGKDILMAPSFVANKQNIRYIVDHSNVDVHVATSTKEIGKDYVIIEKDSIQQTIKADTVIFSTGFRANHDLYLQILEEGYDVVQIGDNVKPGKVLDAIHQGYHFVRVYE